jgi:hypothetical protein
LISTRLKIGIDPGIGIGLARETEMTETGGHHRHVAEAMRRRLI